MHAQQTLSSHPRFMSGSGDGLMRTIDTVYQCARSCIACADACLAEDDVSHLKQCIALDLDCADVCEATGKLLTRLASDAVQLRVSQLMACKLACELCAEECERHASMHEHCRLCAEACRNCEKACTELQEAWRQ
jgi:hypothetical protein